MSKIYQYPLKIDEDVMKKLKDVAEQEGRSVNKQIEFILRQYVKKFHQENNQ